MSASETDSPGADALAALPVALMGFSEDGKLAFLNAEMRRLLRMDEAGVPIGATERDVLRRLAFQGILGPGDAEQRLRDVLALDPAQAHRRLLRDAEGRGLELRLAPLPGGGRVLTIADLTEYVQAREAAELQARATAQVVERLGTGVAQYDADHRLALSNPAYARLIGLDPQVLHEGMTLPEIIRRQQEAGEFDTETAQLLTSRMAAYPKGLTWRAERTRPNGRTLRFDNQVMPDGGWLSEITDISEKHATEQDARRRIALHDTLLQALPVGVAVYAADRTCTLVNPAYNRIMSHSPIQVGENLREILTRRAMDGQFGPLADIEAEVRRRLTLVAAPYSFEQRVAGVSTAHRSVPLPDGGHAMVVADVTALQAAQAELRERAELFRTMIESTRHGIAMFDASNRVIAVNRLAARLCGVPMEQFRPGMTLEDLRELQIAHGAHGGREATASFLATRRGRELKGPDRYRRRGQDGTTIEVVTDELAEGGFVRSYTDVTAQVAAEAEAMTRAATLQTVLDNMRHGIVLYDDDGRLLVCNELTAQLTGLPAECLTPGAHVAELLRQQMVRGELGATEEVDSFMARVGEDFWHSAGHYTRRRPDGTIVEVRTDAVPGGGWIRSFTDITALTLAQDEAAARAAMMKAMLDNMRHGIALFDENQRLLAANALCGELMGIGDALRPGLSHKQMLAIQAATGEFGTPEETERYVRDSRPADSTAMRHRRRRRPDGTELEVVTSPVPGGGFVLTLTDITARVLAEGEAERRADVLATTLNATRQGITLYDAKGVIVAANDIAARMAGLPDGMSMIGRRHVDIVAGQSAIEGPALETHEERLARFHALDRSRRLRYQRRRPDGTVLDVISDPTTDGGYVIATSDVTELVLARERAQAQAAALTATLDASRHTILLYGPDHRVVATNRINLQLTGFASVEEMIGKTYEEVIRHQGRKDFGDDSEGFVQEMLAIDRRRPLRYQRRLADGRVRDIASDPTPDGGFVISVSDVTELVDAREEAQRRAGILQVMLDNNRQGIVLYDADHRLVAANKLAGELMGVPDLLVPGAKQDEILMEQHARGLFAASAAASEAWARYFIEMDRSVSHRTQRDLPDGRRLDIASDPTPGGGHVVSLADVTQLVRAEQAAEHRAGVLKTMLENNTSGIMLYDADHRLVSFNPLAASLSEIADIEACVGRTLEENLAVQAENGSFGHGEERQRNLARMLGLDRRVSHRNQRLAADGRVLIVNSDPTPDGGFVLSLTDVTAVVRAEAEAQRRAEILGVMLGNIRHGIVLFDRSGHVVASNAKLHEMLDLPESLLLSGMHHTAMVDMLHQRGEYGLDEGAHARVGRIREQDRSVSVRSVRTRPNGAIMEVVSDPTPDGGWVVTYTDVTEDRRVRTELENARIQAEAASRAKSRFLATMSHELRTPLNAVIGFSEVLNAQTGPAQVEEFAAAIQEAGRHLLALIDDILDITRAESGSLPVVQETVTLGPLLEGASRMISAAAASAKLLLATDLPPALPRLRADERRLRQVLLNLLSNATKFTPAGGEIVLRARVETTGLVIEVRDTGIGIEAKDLERVFEPFTQIDSALARRFPGSGLGLHLCRALIEAQGGTLELESSPGIGTTARLSFPLERIVEADRAMLAGSSA
ncbi:PAS-domain containing protein [Roseococcus sp.]|uniref:PAS-domain containing protein n=1 Tax=Roseococcus sp. TaxID=2109646 RepID=UPI003BAD0C06